MQQNTQVLNWGCRLTPVMAGSDIIIVAIKMVMPM